MKVLAGAAAMQTSNPESHLPADLSNEARSAKLGARRTKAGIPEQFDLVIANLTGGLLVASADRLKSFAAPSGRLVLSGLMDHEESDVHRAFAGLDVTWRDQEEEWVCLELSPYRK